MRTRWGEAKKCKGGEGMMQKEKKKGNLYMKQNRGEGKGKNKEREGRLK